MRNLLSSPICIVWECFLNLINGQPLFVIWFSPLSAFSSSKILMFLIHCFMCKVLFCFGIIYCLHRHIVIIYDLFVWTNLDSKVCYFICNLDVSKYKVCHESHVSKCSSIGISVAVRSNFLHMIILLLFLDNVNDYSCTFSVSRFDHCPPLMKGYMSALWAEFVFVIIFHFYTPLFFFASLATFFLHMIMLIVLIFWTHWSLPKLN